MSTHAEKEIKPGDLCGWKYGGALILGHVTPDGVNGDKISMQPLSKPGKPGSVVTRRRETIILESELDKEDVEEAVEEGGHIAKSHIHSTSAQAHKMHIGPEARVMNILCRLRSRLPQRLRFSLIFGDKVAAGVSDVTKSRPQESLHALLLFLCRTGALLASLRRPRSRTRKARALAAGRRRRSRL